MLHIPRLRASAAQEGGIVKRLYLPWRVVGCGLVLLNILLCAGVATAQLAVNPLSVSFGSVQPAAAPVSCWF